MDSLFDFLNRHGSAFCANAGAMGWQVGLLILMIACLDRLLAVRVRAVVRHALWLLVPVKLLLPPALSFPTSPAYWIPRGEGMAAPHSRAGLSQVDGFFDGDLEEFGPAEGGVKSKESVRPPRLSLAGAMLGIWGFGVLGFGGMLVIRTLRLRRAIRSAQPAGPEVIAALDWARERLGLRRQAEVVLMEELSSPAVCGVLRPTLLLPAGLAGALTRGQLREVLLHEMAHVKRGDLWLCHGMGLLQGLYWWHPLVWFAQARMRRVAEEATDETVVVALGGDVDSYASTLVQVGRMVVRGTGIRLGLLGILEPESALAGRVRRMLTGRGVASVELGWRTWMILGATALALLPMAGPAQVGALTTAPLPKPALIAAQAVPPREVRQPTEAIAKPATPSPARETSASPLSAQPVKEEAQRKQDEFRARLKAIRLPKVEFTNMPLREVVRWLAAESERQRAGGEPVNFVINRISLVDGAVTDGSTPSPGPAIDPDTGRPVAASTNVPPDTGEVLIRIQPALRDVTLYDALRAVTESASVPLGYSLEDFGVVFFQGAPRLKLVTRVFRVAVPLFERRLQEVLGHTTRTTNTQESLREWAVQLGLALQPPRAFYFNESKGLLMARATVEDMEILEQAIEAMTAVPEQVELETRVFEIPASRLRSLRLDKAVYERNEDGSNGAMVVPEDRLPEILRECRADPRCRVLGAPKITTLSYREAMISSGPEPSAGEEREPAPISIRVFPKVSSSPPTTELEMTVSIGGLAGEKNPGRQAVSVSARITVPDGAAMALVAEGASAPDLRYLLLITPTIIDPAGNRAHPRVPAPAR